MKKLSIIFVSAIAVVLVAAACAPSAPAGGPSMLVDKTVNVGPGGGAAEVTFSATSGQRIQILLSAAPSMQPYANLQFPDGSAVYNPPINTAANGANQAEFVANQTGQYSLTIFDGSNQGGTVSVKIVAPK